MKKLSLNDFAKANVALEKKGMMIVKGGAEPILLEQWSLGKIASNGTRLK